jgi:hypothetical protein
LADNVAITAGAGTTIGTDERTINSTAVHVQRTNDQGGTGWATGQSAVTASAATLVAARETRKYATILNGSNVTIYVGPATVTTGNGFALVPGAAITLPTTVLIQQIAASITGLTGTTYYSESYDA